MAKRSTHAAQPALENPIDPKFSVEGPWQSIDAAPAPDRDNPPTAIVGRFVPGTRRGDPERFVWGLGQHHICGGEYGSPSGMPYWHVSYFNGPMTKRPLAGEAWVMEPAPEGVMPCMRKIGDFTPAEWQPTHYLPHEPFPAPSFAASPKDPETER